MPVYLFVCLLIFLSAFAAACRSAPAGPRSLGPTPTPIPTPIVPEKPTYVVQRGEVVRKLEFTGRVSAVSEARLFFRASGHVKKVYVTRGDMVAEGDLLAELDVEDLLKQLAQAQVRLDTAQLKLSQAEKDNEKALAEARLELDKARLRLQRLLADDPANDVEIARLQLDQARNNLWAAQTRRDGIAGSESSPQYEIDAANAAVAQAETAVKIAELQYQQALERQRTHAIDVQLLQKEVEAAQAKVKSLEEGVDPLLAKEVETAQIELERLSAQVADTRILTPFAGQIASVTLTEGKAVEAFKPVIILADPRAIEISADLSDEQMRDLAEGMAVTIVPADAPGRQIQGHVRRLPYPYGSGGGTVGLEEEDKSTRISIDEAGVELEPGRLARVTIVRARVAAALWLPPAAIRVFEGRKFVVIQDGARQRRVDVTLGIEGEDRAEIKAGLEEGQVVIGP